MIVGGAFLLYSFYSKKMEPTKKNIFKPEIKLRGPKKPKSKKGKKMNHYRLNNGVEFLYWDLGHGKQRMEKKPIKLSSCFKSRLSPYRYSCDLSE